VPQGTLLVDMRRERQPAADAFLPDKEVLPCGPPVPDCGLSLLIGIDADQRDLRAGPRRNRIDAQLLAFLHQQGVKRTIVITLLAQIGLGRASAAMGPLGFQEGVQFIRMRGEIIVCTFQLTAELVSWSGGDTRYLVSVPTNNME